MGMQKQVSGFADSCFPNSSGSKSSLYYCGTTKRPLKRIVLYFPEAILHYRRDANRSKAEAQSVQKTLISAVEEGCHPQPLEIHTGQ